MAEKRARVINELAGPLDRFRKHLRVTGNDLDAELTQDLLAAFAAAEHIVGMVIPLTDIELKGSFVSSLTLRRPLVAVTSVAVDGQLIDITKFSVSGNVLTIDESVSGTAIVVKYQAGFEQIPDDIMAAVLLHAASLFSNPLDSVETLPKASTNLLRPYRSWGLEDGV